MILLYVNPIIFLGENYGVYRILFSFNFGYCLLLAAGTDRKEKIVGQ